MLRSLPGARPSIEAECRQHSTCEPRGVDADGVRQQARIVIRYQGNEWSARPQACRARGIDHATAGILRAVYDAMDEAASGPAIRAERRAAARRRARPADDSARRVLQRQDSAAQQMRHRGKPFG